MEDGSNYPNPYTLFTLCAPHHALREMRRRPESFIKSASPAVNNPSFSAPSVNSSEAGERKRQMEAKDKMEDRRGKMEATALTPSMKGREAGR